MGEIKKFHRYTLLHQASKLVEHIHYTHFKNCGKAGIRAQLLNTETQQLEMNFILEGDKNSLHVLNAVSPAFTCSIPFASYVVDEIQKNNDSCKINRI